MNNLLKNHFMIATGTILVSAAFGLFILPSEFCAAGVTGLSRFINSYIPLPIPVLVLLINLVLLLLGLVLVGSEFILKTLAVSLFSPLILNIFSMFHMERYKIPAPISILLAGSLLGTGVGMILRSNSSSGGFDILGVILNKKLGIPVALVMNICDSLIILLQAVQSHNLSSIVSGLLVIFISNSICHIMLHGIWSEDVRQISPQKY